MNQCEYRELAKSANVLGRSVIEETIDVIRPAHPRIANKLQTIIERGPIEKPERHQGGKETDLFRVVLEQREFEAIVEVFGDREVANVSSEGKTRSEEHTSELQSRPHLVCRLLLEKKKKKKQ